MRKKISLKTRRPELTQAAFRDHYETRHVPLGLSFVDRFQWRRYVRNYVVDTIGEPVGFDAYTEFWIDDDADEEALARFIASPEFRPLDEDDRRFLDVGARFSCDVTETPLWHQPPGDASRQPSPIPRVKATLLLRSATGAITDGHALARRLAAPLGDAVVEARIDRALDPVAGAPFDTLLTFLLEDARPAALDLDALPTALPWSLLTVDPVETPRDLLFEPDATTRAEDHAARAPTRRNPT